VADGLKSNESCGTSKVTLPEPETCAVSSALTTNGPVESTVVVMEPLPENVPTPEPLVWKSPTKIGFPDTSIWRIPVLSSIPAPTTSRYLFERPCQPNFTSRRRSVGAVSRTSFVASFS